MSEVWMCGVCGSEYTGSCKCLDDRYSYRKPTGTISNDGQITFVIVDKHKFISESELLNANTYIRRLELKCKMLENQRNHLSKLGITALAIHRKEGQDFVDREFSLSKAHYDAEITEQLKDVK